MASLHIPLIIGHSSVGYSAFVVRISKNQGGSNIHLDVNLASGNAEGMVLAVPREFPEIKSKAKTQIPKTKRPDLFGICIRYFKAC